MLWSWKFKSVNIGETRNTPQYSVAFFLSVSADLLNWARALEPNKNRFFSPTKKQKSKHLEFSRFPSWCTSLLYVYSLFMHVVLPQIVMTKGYFWKAIWLQMIAKRVILTFYSCKISNSKGIFFPYLSFHGIVVHWRCSFWYDLCFNAIQLCCRRSASLDIFDYRLCMNSPLSLSPYFLFFVPMNVCQHH